MTLAEFLVSRSYARTTSDRKVRCPFHGDSRPSAMLNSFNGRGSIYCFTCGRNYYERDFTQKFNISFDPMPQETSPLLSSLTSNTRQYLPEEVLFTYPWHT